MLFFLSLTMIASWECFPDFEKYHEIEDLYYRQFGYCRDPLAWERWNLIGV